MILSVTEGMFVHSDTMTARPVQGWGLIWKPMVPLPGTRLWAAQQDGFSHNWGAGETLEMRMGRYSERPCGSLKAT